MKKMRMLSVLLAVVMLLTLLAGCTCKHEWKDADCGAPKTCTLCGETEGEKTANHEWKDATTEAPKTCAVCGLTEGERIITDERFTTAACQDLFGNWNGELTMSAQDMGLDANGMITVCLELFFGPDGAMEMRTYMKDLNEYANLMSNALYASYADQGLDRESVETMMQNIYGMTMMEFCMAAAETTDEMLREAEDNYVYYVEDGKLFYALSWEEYMSAEVFTLENGVLNAFSAELNRNAQ